MIFPPTDWGDFTEDEYEVGAPATSNHFERWFRNIVAAFQGAWGAPRLQLAALERLEPGTEIRARNDTATVGQTGVLVPAVTIGIIQHGEIRAAVVVTGSGTGQQGRVTRTRNGVATTVGALTAGTHTVDVPVIPGDTVSIGAIGASITVTNARFQTNGQDLWPGPISAIVEGNRAAP